MSLFSRPILRLFFPADMVESAAPLLSILALAIFFLSLLSVTNAILQANGMASRPMVAMLAGGAVKIASSYILIGVPEIGTAGVPLGTLLCYFVAVCVNLFAIIRHVSAHLPVGRILVRPAAATFLSVGAAYGFYILFGGDGGHKFLVLPAIIVAVLVYAAAVFLTRALTEEDLSLVPGWGKIRRILSKHQRKTAS